MSDYEILSIIIMIIGLIVSIMLHYDKKEHTKK